MPRALWWSWGGGGAVPYERGAPEAFLNPLAGDRLKSEFFRWCSEDVWGVRRVQP